MAEFTVKKAIELAIRTEKEGAAFYAKAADMFADDKDLADIFHQLSLDEKKHEAQFSALLSQAPDDPGAQSDDTYFLQATGASEFFKPNILKADEKLSPQDALLKALNFEKSTLLHYQALSDNLKDSPVLKELIAAEKGHVSALMKVVLGSAKFRGLVDQW